MESLNAEFALYGGQTKCTRSDTVFFPLSEASNRAISLTKVRKSRRKKHLNVPVQCVQSSVISIKCIVCIAQSAVSGI